MIAGHAHKPVFWQSWLRSEEELRKELDGLHSPEDDEHIAAVSTKLELTKAEKLWRDPPPIPVSPPCYFNTGCCAFADGLSPASDNRFPVRTAGC